ncbi:heterogeneous nuclear ribonucleoprotein L-like [Mya arenaria]|uniref:heterogeneous nuclear ribonucleoprotein L-like n=1 Tax=Mya arenaria TaxID=6604 RepID=UPI0022E1A259|nr:heterogeneous nuclear ribonucleoprotein L-like [Mya arenaria]
MASSYDGHVPKRQRTDNGSYNSYKSDEEMEVSQVVHIRGLPDHAVEDDVINAVQHFGTVEFVIIMSRRNQALVEFTDMKGAMACVNFANSNQLCIGGQPVLFNYSKSQHIQRPGGAMAGREGGARQFTPINKILLFTVVNAKYPINVDVMHTICSPHGTVEKIVIFRKQFVQVLVQFENTDMAKAAKDQLQGCDIYSGCCTLRAEYAKTDELNVRQNNSDSWDYTQPSAPEPSRKNAPLLADPRYTAQPTPYEQFEDYGGEQAGFSGQYQNQGAYGGGPQGMGMAARSAPMGRGSVGRGMQQQGYQQGGAGGYGRGRGLQETPQYGGFMETGAGDGSQAGAVVMVYGLDPERMNCDRLFNIFCLYGNVIRVKFLKTKEGSAMIQMGDSLQIERAISNLNGCSMFGSKMIVTQSKQPYLQPVHNPHELHDGTLSFKDFGRDRYNRFSTPETASKNRIIHPTEILHYFKAPAKVTEEQITEMFEKAGAKPPTKILQFQARSEKSSTGLVEWETKSDAMEALALAQHSEVDNPDGGKPYNIRLCFSPSNIRKN